MTREEAIQVLNTYDVNFDGYRAEEIADALDMAIEALSADTVSREEHFDAVANRITDMEERGFVSVVRCKDCRHGWYDDDIEYYVCRHPKGLNEELYGVDYCSYGQTKEQTEYKLPGHDEVMEKLDNLNEWTITGTERVKRSDVIGKETRKQGDEDHE